MTSISGYAHDKSTRWEFPGEAVGCANFVPKLAGRHGRRDWSRQLYGMSCFMRFAIAARSALAMLPAGSVRRKMMVKEAANGPKLCYRPSLVENKDESPKIKPHPE